MKKFIIKNPIVNINWLREKTPITNNNTKIYCDSVEFEIDYNGINKLERNINNSNEFIKCYVHFLNGTNKCIGIYFSVCDKEGLCDDNIIVNLSKEEKEYIINYAIKKIKDSQ